MKELDIQHIFWMQVSIQTYSRTEYIKPNLGENIIELRQRITSMKPKFFQKVIQEILEKKLHQKQNLKMVYTIDH